MPTGRSALRGQPLNIKLTFYCGIVVMFLEGPKELFWSDEFAGWCEAAEARRPPLKSTHAGSGWCFSHAAKGLCPESAAVLSFHSPIRGHSR